MRVYLVRHGEAKSEDADPARHLTDRGVEEVTQIATGAIGQLEVHPRRIVHSGKARARQTAEIWSRLCGAQLAEADGLSPNDDPMTWAKRLDAEPADVMLVGHLPHLERLAALLVNGDEERTVARFPAGGLVAIERHDRDQHEWAVAAVRP